MSFAITLNFADTATPAMKRLSVAIERPDVRKVMGRAIANKLRSHFTKLDRERKNSLGGKRTHFWGQVRRGVQQPELAGDGIKVAVNHVGAAQRYFGGEIVPRVTKFLTIPVHPAAYGRRAREFEDLQFVPQEDGPPLLVKPAANADDLGEVYYVLKRRVFQAPDSSVLPEEEELQTAAVDAGDEYFQTLVRRTLGSE